MLVEDKAVRIFSKIKYFRGRYYSPFLILSVLVLSLGYWIGFWGLKGIIVTCALFILLKEIYERFIRNDADPDVPVLRKLGSRIIHGSHRGGASGFGPENTIFNYRRVVNELKTDVLEIDLRTTLDDRIILMHDEFVDRTTDGNGHVKHFTLDEIKTLNAGLHYPDIVKNEKIRVPSLEEVLEEFKDNKDLVYFFDVKDRRSVPIVLGLF